MAKEEEEEDSVCDEMRIVSKEALVLIKLASVFPQQCNHRHNIYPLFFDGEREKGKEERR